MKFLLVLVATVAYATAAPACKGKISDGFCYFIGKMARGGALVEQAESNCEQEGATLGQFRSLKAYSQVHDFLLASAPGTMILTGMSYDQKLNKKVPLLADGEPISYKPKWFEGHPIKENKHGEMVFMANRNDKFNGMMNAQDGSRYSVYLCEKKMKEDL
uniref:uncharacterized protein LOC120331005 n=1 Tax=Styela clava TaxID=7725 RepID=UPI00193965E0|nr:uncharacterized protein LOC120331005 [Styela clava]